MMSRIHFFYISVIAVLSVLMIGLQSCKQNTPVEAKIETTQPKKEQPKEEIIQQNTSYSVDNDIDSSKVQIVDSKRFADEVCSYEHGKYGFHSNVPIIIDFYADWCKPCCLIAPYLVEFAKKYEGKILIYKVNIDKCADIADKFNIESIPTLIYYKPNGKPYQKVGAPSKAELEQSIQALLR